MLNTGGQSVGVVNRGMPRGACRDSWLLRNVRRGAGERESIAGDPVEDRTARPVPLMVCSGPAVERLPASRQRRREREAFP